MKRYRKVLDNRGVTLVFVLAVLLIMSTLSVAIFALFSSNMNEEQMQTDAIRAHYVAQTGVDVAFGALLQNNHSLLTAYFDKAITVVVTSLTDTVTLDNGSASIVVSSYIEGTERFILITSTGSISNSSVTQVSKMSFNVKYPQIQKWE
jgi:type II secretory pathway pseudopilin PulG